MKAGEDLEEEEEEELEAEILPSVADHIGFVGASADRLIGMSESILCRSVRRLMLLPKLTRPNHLSCRNLRPSCAAKARQGLCRAFDEGGSQASVRTAMPLLRKRFSWYATKTYASQPRF